MAIPKFHDTNDPDDYIAWESKVSKLFRMYKVRSDKRVDLASLELEGYAQLWWEQLKDSLEVPIESWNDMKKEMYKRFVPHHYARDLYKKLQELKQGIKSVDEYYKEMESTLSRAHIVESEEQSMACFLNGLTFPIKKIVEFLTYENLVELVHQAMKAERQVADELKYVKTKSFFANKASSSTTPMAQVTPPSNTKGAPPLPSSTFKKTTSSPQASKSYVTCYKCGGQGHKSFECTNKKVMIVNDNGDYESMSIKL